MHGTSCCKSVSWATLAVMHVCIMKWSLCDNRRPALADGVAMAITERAYEQGGLLVAAAPGRHIVWDIRQRSTKWILRSATARILCQHCERLCTLKLTNLDCSLPEHSGLAPRGSVLCEGLTFGRCTLAQALHGLCCRCHGATWRRWLPVC